MHRTTTPIYHRLTELTWVLVVVSLVAQVAVAAGGGGGGRDVKASREDICRHVQGHDYYECLYPFSLPDCSQHQDVSGSGETTVVSALYDLRREHWPHFKRHFDVYLYYSVQLMKLNVPMVIFVEEKVYDFIKYHRQGKENITKIIIRPLEQLEYHKYMDSLKKVMTSPTFKAGNTLLKHPEGFSAEYNMLMSNKLSFLEEVIASNPFRSSYFLWIDAGYGHGKDIYPRTCHWQPHRLLGDAIIRSKVVYIEIADLKRLSGVHDIYKKYLTPFINGGFFAADGHVMTRYARLYNKVFEDFLKAGMMDDDQTLAVASVFKEPDLFHLERGSWYDAFDMFT